MQLRSKNFYRLLAAFVLAVVLVAGFGLDPIGVFISENTNKTAGNTREVPTRSTGTVTRVVDGDTVRIDYDGKTQPVRLIGVDTPEINWPESDTDEITADCYGLPAREYLVERISGETVRTESDPSQPETDTYGRRLVYLYLDGELINKTLLSEGYARKLTAVDGYDKQADFRRTQKQAKATGRGLWSACR
jgi:micrococcal nuclease